MSEYQYYEFQAVDRPLGDTEREELRALSSRARITATSFINSYDWGDFGGDPAKLMERYFDLFLYLANWGTRRFSMSLPKRMVDEHDLKNFLVEQYAVTVYSTEEKLILDVVRDEVEDEDWDDGTGRLAGLAPLRADVLNGDLRIFYLIWLMAVESDEVPEHGVEPLPGIAPLTASLEAFADFFGIDGDLLEAAASAGSASLPAEPSGSAVADYIRAMDEDDKVALLVSLHDGDDPHLGAQLRRRVRANLTGSTETRPKQRTVSELREIASRIAAERERAAAERAETERLRREKEQAEAQKRRLAALATRGEAAWREVESMIDRRNPSGYEKAVALLIDLRALAGNQNRPDEFRRRLAEIRSRNENKARFLERLSASALD